MSRHLAWARSHGGRRASPVWLIAAQLVLLAGLIGSLAVEARAERRLALVVGNGAYQHAAPLANPANDARDMAAALERTGFEVIMALDAGKRQMDEALRRFADGLSTADVALLFYAGHGLQVGAENYLMPVDARLAGQRDLEFEGVRLDFVLRQMEIDRAGRTSIVILDACRDNPLARSLARSMGTRSATVGTGLAAVRTGVGTFIAYATEPGNVALDGSGRNSPFTKALIANIETPGRNLNQTMIEVRKAVIAATDGRQVPWDHSALTGDFFFVPGAVQAKGAPAQAAAPVLPDNAERIARLAEARARLAVAEDRAKELQMRLLEARGLEGRAREPAERQRLQQDSLRIQMDMSRASLAARKHREEIAALTGTDGTAGGAAAKSASAPVAGATAAASPREAGTAVTASLPPIKPRGGDSNAGDGFALTDNVRIDGATVRSFRAASPVACQTACAEEAQCVAFRHGRKHPVMSQCDLFSSVAAREEDPAWRSGTRN